MAATPWGDLPAYRRRHMDDAETWINIAIETDERHRMPWWLAKDYALYADFFKKKGDLAKTERS